MTTYHSIKRTVERTGYNAKASERIIMNAMTRGKNAESFPTREREYLEKTESKGEGCRVIVYNGYCFILRDDYCITMYPLPKWFGKKQHDGKRKIRDAKKYMRFNANYDELDNEFEYAS